MIILDPQTGRNVEIVVPPRAPTLRLEELAAAKARLLADKEARRAAAWTALRQAELDAGAL